jgi:ABC-type uncharacterized transport system permease subunit
MYAVEIVPVTSQFTFNQKHKVMPSAGKVMLTMFWDYQGVLSAQFQNLGENMNSAHTAKFCRFRMQFAENLQAN